MLAFYGVRCRAKKLYNPWIFGFAAMHGDMRDAKK